MKFPFTYQQVRQILNDELDVCDRHIFEPLYDYYFAEMPYGIAKARDGDPAQWIYNRLYEEFGTI